jgi:selenocysteine lyase/cysteine desulfurase
MTSLPGLAAAGERAAAGEGAMLDRREFIGALGAPAAAALAVGFIDVARAREAVAALAGRPGSPDEIAADEWFWFEVQRAFVVDRSLINLNNGGVSPSPAVVQEAMRRHLEFSNAAPAYTMWRVLEPQRETVRASLAELFGCGSEEIAVTRNTSEGLETCQLGFDLERGDEVLTTTQDYPRMITTFRQRERREGVVLRQFPIPTPCEDAERIVSLFEQHITPHTRLILVSHIVFLTGQVMPVRRIAELGRRRGIPVLVDGAHSFAHLDFRHADVDCDYYATSLHKWLFAPHGTGMLYVRRERIAALWPLMAAPEEMTGDIRKFEEIGTHPAANFLAIAEAIAFHRGIGAARKQARLRALRDHWARPLAALPGVRLHTSLKPEFSCGLATVQIEGVDSGALADHLWRRHRIIVAPIKHPEFEGVRVAPSVYTTRAELDRFVEAMSAVAAKGLPAA